MSHTEGAQVDWPDFWVALLLWGPDTQGQLLKAAGFTFRAAAAVPTALIHFMVSVEGYSALQQQVPLLFAHSPDTISTSEILCRRDSCSGHQVRGMQPR